MTIYEKIDQLPLWIRISLFISTAIPVISGLLMAGAYGIAIVIGGAFSLPFLFIK